MNEYRSVSAPVTLKGGMWLVRCLQRISVITPVPFDLEQSNLDRGIFLVFSHTPSHWVGPQHPSIFLGPVYQHPYHLTLTTQFSTVTSGVWACFFQGSATPPSQETGSRRTPIFLDFLPAPVWFDRG